MRARGIAHMAKSAHAVEYDAALEVFRAASREYRAAALSYRAREIDDAEFLAARRKFNAAQNVCDVAETAYIDACNATGET